MEKAIHAVEKAIGYIFYNPSILETALTHSSYANENNTHSNESMEFFGDSILNFIISEYLFKTCHTSEGTLSVLRSKIVSEVPLAQAVQKLNISKHLRCGVGETKSNPVKSASVMADLFEAIVAAIYLDSSSSIYDAEKFILENLGDAIDAAIASSPKGTLNAVTSTPNAVDIKPKKQKKQISELLKPAKKDAPKPDVSAETGKKEQKPEVKRSKKEPEKSVIKETPKEPENPDKDFVVDYKSKLQIAAQKQPQRTVKYVLLSQSGSAHHPVFEVAVEIDGMQAGIGKGGRKKDAEQIAAKQALTALRLN